MAKEYSLVTPKYPWYSLRSGVATDDTALAAFGYANWPSSGTFDDIDTKIRRANAIQILFYGTDADDEDATYILYGRHRGNGPIQHLLSGAVTLGGQLVTTDPLLLTAVTAYWADTITVTAGILADDAMVLDSGNDRIAELQVDVKSIQDLFCEFDLDGGSSTSASMNAIICGV